MKLGFDNRAAFAPFYDSTVVYSSTVAEPGFVRRPSLTIAVCWFDGGMAEADANASAPTSDRVATAIIRRDDWPEVAPPRRGDTVERGGERFRVLSVVSDGDGWTLELRSRKAVRR